MGSCVEEYNHTMKQGIVQENMVAEIFGLVNLPMFDLDRIIDVEGVH